MTRQPYLAEAPEDVYVRNTYKVTRTGNPSHVYPQVRIEAEHPDTWGEPDHDEVAELGLDTDYSLDYRLKGRGREKKTRDVSRLREPLHIQFANWDDSLEGFVRFTGRFGYLDLNGGEFYSHWLYRQKQFRQYWQWNGQVSKWSALAGKLTEHLFASVREEVEPDTEYSIGGSSTVSESAVSFELDGLRLVPRLKPGSLWQYLLTLLAEEPLGRLRVCENPDCPAPYFIARRKDQTFCGSDCAGLIAKRRWWQEHGKEWRKNRKKSGSRKKKPRR